MAIPLRPLIKQNARVHAEESPTTPKQRNGIFICRDGIALNIVERHATAHTLNMHKVRAMALRSD